MGGEEDLLQLPSNASLSGCVEVESGADCAMSSNSTLSPPPTPASALCKPQEYYSFNYAVVGTLFQSIIFVVGVIGNVLVCTVVRRTRSMHSTTNCYLVSLACADTITLVASVPQEVLSYHILGDQWVWGSVGCTTMIYLQYLGIDASALSLTAFTIERYIAICHPMKSKSICTISRAKKIIAGCWLFAIVYCSPWFLLTQTRTVCVQGIGEVETCSFRLRRDSTEYLVMFFCDLMLFYVIPLLLSMVLYTLIGRMLLSNSRNKFTSGASSSGGGGAGGAGGLSNGTQQQALSVSEAAAKSNQARVQVVKMLACVVVIFATLWVPYRGLLVYNSFATMNSLPPYLDLWYLMFAKTCIYMNSAINPILYNAMSDKFRKAFRRHVSCGTVESENIQRYRFQSRHTRALSEVSRATATSPAALTSNVRGSHSAAGGGGGGGGKLSPSSAAAVSYAGRQSLTTATTSSILTTDSSCMSGGGGGNNGNGSNPEHRGLSRLSSAPAEQHPMARHRLSLPKQQQQQQQPVVAAILHSSGDTTTLRRSASSASSSSSNSPLVGREGSEQREGQSQAPDKILEVQIESSKGGGSSETFL